MTWSPYYRGDGVPRDVTLHRPPPWREFPRRPLATVFQPPPGLTDAVNAALSLRRPLLITGAPGSGKSTVVDSVAAELKLGPALRWHITSRSTLLESLYRYDVLGRIHARQLGQPAHTDDIAPFIQLGPLGTALLPADRPRALLIDEIDKSDLDLPSDLLDALERGEFEIPELARHEHPVVAVREWGGSATHPIERGMVRCTEFPVIVMTSNGERDFPAPFLRRCIRYTMPLPTRDMLHRVVRAHLDLAVPGSGPLADLVDDFLQRLRDGENLAIDQLLNAVFMLSGDQPPQDGQREHLVAMLLRELSRA
ncbi:AAA family ATPase [Phytohabitans houttuyneae]|uniref:ATPase AAA n=1 Tax=Phytohabitans houttuyneae TaxID=1076126 RepID=A0A6V8KD88_9ACTN|nr:AAA family ATPase [Phytohabitans houttuyneae]GFJ81400.1 ATPase AAA [Phytohabitans houttuyneae]